MNRSKTIALALVVAIAVVATGVLAFNSGAANPSNATLKLLWFQPMNSVDWGYKATDGTLIRLGSSSYASTGHVPTRFKIPYADAGTSIVLYIKDNSCGGVVYFSDGTSSNPTGIDHATITADTRYDYVDIADGNVSPGCTDKTTTKSPAQGEGTFQAWVSPDGTLKTG